MLSVDQIPVSHENTFRSKLVIADVEMQNGVKLYETVFTRQKSVHTTLSEIGERCV